MATFAEAQKGEEIFLYYCWLNLYTANDSNVNRPPRCAFKLDIRKRLDPLNLGSLVSAMEKNGNSLQIC